MGSNKHYPEEAPVHSVTVDGFWMDRYPITNAQFRAFVEATGYITFAERVPDAANYPGADPALLVPASIVFSKPSQRVDMRNHYNWWTYVPGANWRHPEGPASSLNGREQHPVVHVAYEDVLAYAHWVGKELPSEAEWEFAAWGELVGTEYAWGDELMPEGQAMANTWQGEFPIGNTLVDGFEGTSPVGFFPANSYGLYDMIGNIWEWTADWYGDHHQVTKACCSVRNPRGGALAQS
ncbi:MAG: formylglycine-generating enzyme family protein, partial [Ktedonobacteraceae bacterium]|nr:formylglycine-generating enzyme family protein [Ktedonobacteraceae bacterium]